MWSGYDARLVTKFSQMVVVLPVICWHMGSWGQAGDGEMLPMPVVG